MAPLDLAPAIDAAIAWLVDGARSASAPEEILDQLCNRLLAGGLAIDRCAVFVRTLHPHVMARRFLWEFGKNVEIDQADYALSETETYRTSSVPEVMRTGRAIRRRLTADDGSDDFNILGQLRAEGFSDYVIYPLDFLDGQHHAVSWATRKEGGFSDQDLTSLSAVCGPLARIAEIHGLRRVAVNLLDAYVGHRAGQRILEGKIRRGDIETIHAAIMMADLRGFTALSNQRPAEEVVGMLNSYYEGLVPAIETEGGEVLKFIGDGLLAIFPVPDGDRGLCDAALRAAEDGQRKLRERHAGVLCCGMALHLGDVLYGNIGSLGRLDFTAIGPAINLTARLEKLTRDLGRPVITSEAFAKGCSRPLESCGGFRLRGFEGDIQVFAPVGKEEA